jgi:hypothetical protein
MSEVGITSIALGVLIVCSRLPLWVAPAAFLGWFKRVIGILGTIVGSLLIYFGVLAL